MEYNKSLSARVRRRNTQGFVGKGTDANWVKKNSYGDYKDAIDSNKHYDYKRELARKEKLGYTAKDYKIIDGNIIPMHNSSRCMSKKYADNHQKL